MLFRFVTEIDHKRTFFFKEKNHECGEKARILGFA